MAIYHCSIKIISRGKGKSAVGASAYRSGEILTNEYDGITHDFTKKRGIVHKEILLPSHAPPDFADRSILWNSVERIEKSKNSQLAREIEIALPKELAKEKQIQMVRDYIQDNFVSAGMCADFAIHDKGDGNPHAHIMLTMRPLERSGQWGAKSRKEYILDKDGQRVKLKNGTYKSRKADTVDWNNRENAEVWRRAWADIVNRYLAEQEVTERVDHRSYKRQNIEKIPTVHLGVAAVQMEQRGIVTDKGNRNRLIEKHNRMLTEIKQRIGKLLLWMRDKKSQSRTADSISPEINQSVLERLNRAKNEVSDKEIQKKSIYFDINKTGVRERDFLKKHNITSYPQLNDYIQSLSGQYGKINGDILRLEKLLDEKKQILEQAENYLKYKPCYEEYGQVKPEKRGTCYGKYRTEIALYKQAREYLYKHLQGQTVLKPKAWRAELEAIMQKKESLSRTAEKLKEKLSDAEGVRREAEKTILNAEQRKRQTQRNDLSL